MSTFVTAVTAANAKGLNVPDRWPVPAALKYAKASTRWMRVVGVGEPDVLGEADVVVPDLAAPAAAQFFPSATGRPD